MFFAFPTEIREQKTVVRRKWPVVSNERRRGLPLSKLIKALNRELRPLLENFPVFIVTAFIQFSQLRLPSSFALKKCKLIFSTAEKSAKEIINYRPFPFTSKFPTTAPVENKQTFLPQFTELPRWIFACSTFICWMLNVLIHKFKPFFSVPFHLSQSLSRAKFVPDFQPTEEVAQPALSTHPPGAPPDEKFSPPTPEEAERIISHLLPR